MTILYITILLIYFAPSEIKPMEHDKMIALICIYLAPPLEKTEHASVVRIFL